MPGGSRRCALGESLAADAAGAPRIWAFAWLLGPVEDWLVRSKSFQQAVAIAQKVLKATKARNLRSKLLERQVNVAAHAAQLSDLRRLGFKESFKPEICDLLLSRP